MVYNITSNDYEFVDGPDTSSYYVRLLGGAYDNTVVHYGKVTAKVNEDEETATLSFDYEMVEGEDTLKENIEFNQRVGAILEYIIQSAFDSNEYRIGNDDDNTNATNDNTEESTQ